LPRAQRRCGESTCARGRKPGTVTTAKATAMAPPWFLVKGKRPSGEEVSIRLLLLALLEDQIQTNRMGKTGRWALARERTPITQKRGRNGCLCICASTSAVLQQNHADRKKHKRCHPSTPVPDCSSAYLFGLKNHSLTRTVWYKTTGYQFAQITSSSNALKRGGTILVLA
jgi:hypothetical protein